MKTRFTFLFIIAAAISFGQTSLNDENAEELARFQSVLIDYEIQEEKIVALTKKNFEYFIYFTDSKRAKLFESFDIFFPTDLEVDCMGNLFVVGLDSAIQIKVTDFVSRVQSVDLATYNNTIRSCKAYFKENLVRTAPSNKLIYEPIDDSAYTENPIAGFIQITADRMVVVNNSRQPMRTASDGSTLADNHQLSIRNDAFSAPSPRASRSTSNRTVVQAMDQPAELAAFQVGDSLWVFDQEDNLLFVYDDKVACERIQTMTAFPHLSEIHQDRYTDDVYSFLVHSRTCEIRKIDRFGDAKHLWNIFKGRTKSDLKISNGYIYYRDSTGKGESISRIKLD